MKQIRIGRLAVSELGFGTAGLALPYKGKEPPEDIEAIAILHKAIEVGINFFDTAPTYSSESLVGIAVGDNHSMCVATKFSRNNWRDSIERSLALLRHVDIFQLHNASGADAALLRMVRMYLREVHAWDGLVGATVYDPEGEGRPLLESGSIDLLQVPFNFFDQRAASLFEDARQRGVAVVLRSALLGGRFAADTEESRRLLAVLDSTLEMLPVHAIRFALNTGKPVLVGINSRAELFAALEAVNLGPLAGDFTSLAVNDLDLIDLRRRTA